MSDTSQGPGWWQATDGKWYPPQDPDTPPGPGWWKASDGNWYPPAEETAGAASATGAAGSTPAEPSAPTEQTPATPAPAAPGATAPPAVSVPTAPIEAKKKGKGGLVAAGLVVVLILLAVVAVVVVKGRDSGTTTTAGNATTTAGNGSSGNGSSDNGSSGNSGNGNGEGGQSSDPTTPSGPDVEPDKDVTLTKDVVVVRSDGGKAVKASASDGSTITIAGDAPGADQLAEGKILLLTGVTVAKVTSVEKSGDDVTLGLEAATLPEVIEDGELKWENQDVDPSTARLRLTGEDGYEAGKDGDGGKGAGGDTGGGTSSGGSGEDGTGEDGGDISIPDAGDLEISAPTLTPGFVEGESAAGATAAAPATATVRGETISGNAKDFTFEISHEATGGSGHKLGLKLTSKGEEVSGNINIDVDLKSLASSGGAKIEGHQVKNFDFTMADLGGSLKFDGNLQGLQNVAKIQMPPFFKLPFSLQFPFPIAGIPFTMSITGTIQVIVSMSSAGGTLGGQAEITFGGDAGFHFEGGSVTLNGKRVQDATDLVNKIKGGGGTVGANVTTELPKIGLGFGLKQIFAGVYLSNGSVVSMDVLPPPVMCSGLNVAYVLAGGVEATFLGKEFDVARKAIVDKRWEWGLPSDSKCGKK